MPIEYWVDAENGDNVNGDGSSASPKKTILGARGSQKPTDVDGGMKYRGGIVHLQGGKFRQSFNEVPYPKNMIINPAGNTINEWCPASLQISNKHYHDTDNPLIFTVDEGETAILTAFRTDPEPGSDPSTWDIQGISPIRIINKRNIHIQGYYRLEVWGGLPVPYVIESTSPQQPTDDVVIENVIFRFVNPEALYQYTKEGGRRIWLEDCIIDPFGTAMSPDDLVLSDRRAVIGGVGAKEGPSLFNGRIG